MAVEEGQDLLHYRLIERIGAGGMGVVWRALDTTLDREVAIKVLPAAFVGAANRIARLEREAKLLAALNHPGIASVYGLHEAGGTRFVAMELVPGEDLAERLRRGRLPVEESVRIARRIAQALEAAHARGVIHRDLKPANVRITPEGTVKILDFGLAKSIVSNDRPADEEALAPTVTSAGSAAGVLLGTAAYMSPEQARGQEVDQRCDVWAFGCVLWECLTGEPLFARPTPSDTLGAVLREEPDLGRLPADTPSNVRRVLRRCLARDPAERYHHVADVRLDLDDADPHEAVARSWPRGYRIAVAALAVALVATLAVTLPVLLRRSVDVAGRHDGNPLAGARFTKVTDFPGAEVDAAISPDGRFVAFASDHEGPFEIFVGQLGGSGFRKLTGGLDDPTMEDLRAPIRSVGFSGDGSEIWFGGGTGRRLRVAPLLGGPMRNFLGDRVVNVEWSPDGERIVYHTSEPGDPIYVADRDGANGRLVLGSPAGMHQHYPIWSVDGRWIYLSRGREATLETDLWRVRPDGEGLERLTRDKLRVSYPTPVDERTVLFSARDADGAGPWLWAVDVETKACRRVTVGLEQYTSLSASADRRRLVATVQDPRATLWSVPILEREATEADAAPLPGLRATRALAPRFGGSALFFLSSRGTGDGLWRLLEGEVTEVWKGGETALLEPAAISADGSSVALLLRRTGGWHVHVMSGDGAVIERLSPSVEARGSAAWSPDGRWVAVGGSRDGETGLFRLPVDGGDAERIVAGDALNPVWSPDGSLIVYEGPQVEALSPLLAVRPDGTAVDLPDVSVLRGGERARFLPDGSGLIYMVGSWSAQDFWQLDLATKRTRRLTRLDPAGEMRTFDVTPDGAQIVFDRLNENSDIVSIEMPEGALGDAGEGER